MDRADTFHLRLHRLERDMVAIKQQKTEHEQLIDLIGSETQSIHKKMDERFAEIDRKFDAIDTRFAQIDARFVKIDEQFAQVHSRISMETLKLHDKIDTLDSKVSALSTDMALVLRALDIKK